jgi:predicted AAA+ superfamily ATPase
MYIDRAIESRVLHTSQSFPAVLVTGPRQVGKTTLLQRLGGEERNYVTLDDPNARFLAKTDPAMFLERYEPPVTIDEVQYAPELFQYIKMNADRSRKNGGYWLTGSQIFHTMKNVSESLAGRVGILNLLGLSNNEINGTPSEAFTTSPNRLAARLKTVQKMTLSEIYSRIFRGSSPALYAKPDTPLETFYSSYISSYLQRDIRDLTQVADEMAFFNFMVCAAARTSKPVVYEEIAKDAGISAPTAKKWMSILVSSHIVALVQPYHNNALKRVTKMPVLHFLDTGLCAYLLKWGSPEVLERGAMSGAFFESWVFAEIYKSYLNAAKEPPVYYYRDKDQKEIDLLLFRNGTLYPIEIKKSASPGSEALKHFKVLAPVTEPEKFGALEQYKLEVGEGSVLCMAPDLLPADKKNWYVPAWLI